METHLPLIPRILEKLLGQWADRRQGKNGDYVQIHRHHLYILPTRHGMIFFLVLLLVLVGAINYENSLGFMLAFLLGSLGLLGMIHTHQNLNRLELRLSPAEPVFCGQTIQFPVTISHPGQDIHPALHLVAEGSNAINLQLTDQQSHTLHLPLKAGQRGYQKLPRVKLFTEYPLGLFHAWSWINFDSRCLVYPAPAKQHTVFSHRSRGGQGKHVDEKRGVEDFAGIRQYQPGDHPSHLAWKAIAKTGEMQTKLYTNESAKEVCIDWSQLKPTLDIEQKLSTMCRMVIDADEQGIVYAMHLPDTSIPASSGRQHKHRCLKALALFGITDE